MVVSPALSAYRPVPTVLELKVTSVDHGASISLFSQYPGEEEVLFPPMSFLAPEGPTKLEVTADGVVSVVGVRININLTASTLEEHVERKKRSHEGQQNEMVSQRKRANEALESIPIEILI